MIYPLLKRSWHDLDRCGRERRPIIVTLPAHLDSSAFFVAAYPPRLGLAAARGLKTATDRCVLLARDELGERCASQGARARKHIHAFREKRD